MYMRPRVAVRRARGEEGENRGDESSLFSYSGIDPAPAHHELSPTPVGCDKSALVAFPAEYPAIKDYARRSFIRERLRSPSFTGLAKLQYRAPC